MPKSKKKKATCLEIAKSETSLCSESEAKKRKNRKKKLRKLGRKKELLEQLLKEENTSSPASSDSNCCSSEELNNEENRKQTATLDFDSTVGESNVMGSANSNSCGPFASGGTLQNNQEYMCPSQNILSFTQQNNQAFTGLWPFQNVNWSSSVDCSSGSQDLKNLSGNSFAVTTNSQETNIKTLREWEYTKYGSKLAAAGRFKSTSHKLVFTLLSYNVLAQDLLESHSYLYTKHKKGALNWKYRSKLLWKEISEANADIMCLQEVQASHLHTFYYRLRDLGYDYVYKQRTGENVDGVAIYYKTDLFKLVDYTSVEYYQPGIDILDRHNVGLVAKLVVKNENSSQHIVVSTTHLLFNPRRHDVKLAQMQLLLTEIERFAFRDMKNGAAVYWPVILTGDMNFEPHTGVYKLLTQGMFKYEGLCSKTLTTNKEGRPLNRALLPKRLEILDTCQHWGILSKRHTEKMDHIEELKLLKVLNTDHEIIMRDMNMAGYMAKSFEEYVEISRQKEFFNSFAPSFTPSSIPPMPNGGYGTGQLNHNLNLRSVYNPSQPNAGKQVTTNQVKWVTVDYIFYTCKKEENDSLRLLARYKLLNATQARNIGPIPNMVSASDHYPLLAKFCMKFKKF